MKEWPENYECDGQMSLFEKPIVDFSQCMNPPEEGNDEGVQSNTKDRKSEPQYKSESTEQTAAIETVQKSDEYSFPAQRWTLVDCEDMDDEKVVE